MEPGWRGDDSESALLCRACVESNLNTRMIVIVPVSTTAAQFKERVRHCHLQNFPEHGNVRIKKLSVRVVDHYYTFNEGPVGVICQGTDARFKVEMEVVNEKVELNGDGVSNRMKFDAAGFCQRYSSSQNLEFGRCLETPVLARVVLDSPEVENPRGVEDARESRQHSQAEKDGEEKEKNVELEKRRSSEEDESPRDDRSKPVVSEASLSKELEKPSEVEAIPRPGEAEAREQSPSKTPATEKEKGSEQKAMEVEVELIPGQALEENREKRIPTDDETTQDGGGKPAVSQPGSTGDKLKQQQLSSEAQAPKPVVAAEPSLSQAGNSRKRKAGGSKADNSLEAPVKAPRIESQEVSQKLDAEPKETKPVEAESRKSEQEAANHHANNNNVEDSASDAEEELDLGSKQQKKQPEAEVNKASDAGDDKINTPRSTNSTLPLDLCTSKNVDDVCDNLITQHFSDSSISKLAGKGGVFGVKCRLNRVFSGTSKKGRVISSSSSEESDDPVVSKAPPAAAAAVEESDSDSDESSEEAPNMKSKVGLIVPNMVDSEEVHEAPKKQSLSDSATSKSVSSKSEKVREALKTKPAEVLKKITATATTTAQQQQQESLKTKPAEVPKKTTTTTTTTQQQQQESLKTKQTEVPGKTTNTTTAQQQESLKTKQAEVLRKNATTTANATATQKQSAPVTKQAPVVSAPVTKQAPAKQQKPAQARSSESSSSDSESSSTDWSGSSEKKTPARASGVDTRFQHFVDKNDGLEQLINLRMLKRREEASNTADVVYETQDIDEEPGKKGDLEKDGETLKQKGGKEETPKHKGDEEIKAPRYKQRAGRNKSKSKEAAKKTSQPGVKPVEDSSGTKRKPEISSTTAGATTRSQKKQKGSKVASSPPVFERDGFLASPPPLAVRMQSGRKLKGEQFPCPFCGKCYTGRSPSYYRHKKKCEAEAVAKAAAKVEAVA